MKVARLYRFRASHSLPGVAGYDHSHYHDYTIEVVAAGGLDDDGMVVDTSAIDCIVEPLCHEWNAVDLNTVFSMATTVENISSELYAMVAERVSAVESVTVWEDDDRWGQAP